MYTREKLVSKCDNYSALVCLILLFAVFQVALVRRRSRETCVHRQL